MNMLGLRDLVLIAPNPSSFQQQGQQHHQQQEHHGNNNLPLMPSSSALSVGLGIFPLLTTTPCMPQPQPHPHHHHHHQHHEIHQECNTNNTNTNNNNNNYWNLKMCPEVMSSSNNNNNECGRKVVGGGVMIVNNMEENEENGGGGGDNSIYGGGDFRVCQDCGNRAKKDCNFRRCRTCCKGRGYDCTTHVKSTWVPASRRRDRDMVVATGGGGDGDDGGGASSSGAKRPRALLGGSSSQNVPTNSHSSTSNNATTTTTTKSFDISSYQQDPSFKQSLPGHVRAPAMFRCHRMAAIGNGEDELAYLATVHIKGHVFKGFLYDHGVDGKNEIPYVSVLQLGNNNGSVKNNNRECSSSAIGVPTSAYPASAC